MARGLTSGAYACRSRTLPQSGDTRRGPAQRRHSTLHGQFIEASPLPYNAWLSFHGVSV